MNKILDKAITKAIAGDFGDVVAKRVAFCQKMRWERLSSCGGAPGTCEKSKAAVDMQAAMNDFEESIASYKGNETEAQVGKLVAKFFGDIGAFDFFANSKPNLIASPPTSKTPRYVWAATLMAAGYKYDFPMKVFDTYEAAKNYLEGIAFDKKKMAAVVRMEVEQ